jgi:LCP family protein required for cell wall assembly
MLSIPRDLWLPIPGVGEQRINTAYFFAEAQESGTGSRAIRDTIQQNFRVPVHYYALMHMPGLVGVIDALGGVDVLLPRNMGGLTAGAHHLSGTEALALVRERYSGDDFSRMIQGQILIEATVRKMFSPDSWPRLPGVLSALFDAVETDIPVWQWPRLIFAIVRAPLFGVEARTITPDMVVPFTTTEGAQVLGPNWELILPVVEGIFGK